MHFVVVTHDRGTEYEYTTSFDVDDEDDLAAAKEAMADEGIDSLPVWSGDPDESDSVKTSTVVLAAAR